jgi:hypothetical protein
VKTLYTRPRKYYVAGSRRHITYAQHIDHRSLVRQQLPPHTQKHTTSFLAIAISTATVVFPRLQGPRDERNMKKEKPVKSQNSLIREDCTCALAVRCSAPVVLLAAPLSPAASLHLLILLGDPFRVRLVHNLA